MKDFEFHIGDRVTLKGQESRVMEIVAMEGQYAYCKTEIASGDSVKQKFRFDELELVERSGSGKRDESDRNWVEFLGG